MSFSSIVKNELCRHIGETRHCLLAEIAGIINMCGEFIHDEDQVTAIKIQTENVTVAKKIFTLLKKTFNINTEVVMNKSSYLHKTRQYGLYIKKVSDIEKIISGIKIKVYEEEGLKKVRFEDELLIQSKCCKRAYIRGAFLGGGSISDPEKNYHLEFVNNEIEHAKKLQDLINAFGIDSKIISRKKYYILYLKEGSQIVDLLNVMEAHVALMDLENIRIMKEMRNNVNRIVNCETANLNKTVSAAVKQIDDINYIIATIGLLKIPKNLREMAEVRLEYRDASLKELGEKLDPPVGKSGVNHRLRKISAIAEKLREEREVDL